MGVARRIAAVEGVGQRHPPHAAQQQIADLGVARMSGEGRAEHLVHQPPDHAAQPPLPDSLFETWVQNNDAIFLNSIPVHWKSGRPAGDQNGADLSSPVVSAAAGTF